ncbi:DUF2087 domain-containing protein [Arthrobacter sp. CDRTa11]|uniref:DUF2087 domain-containing protein n=1 Tax=Arthrobacter sp. CDRTa11 TaxID=2651199 RepID=UPI002265CB0A|nr:DUF2087 domain-containing protein [Arthrobacter sp. CDRTa11]UZX02251.1 DUF2087 domain-containing protein [Arthrobacter sp. CDRTa11]
MLGQTGARRFDILSLLAAAAEIGGAISRLSLPSQWLTWAQQGEVNALGGASNQGGPHWRRVVAALANRDARTAYAQIVLGAKAPDVLAGMSEQRRTRAVEVLLAAGLVERTRANELEASGTIFQDLLTQQPRRLPQTGVDRFMRLGRIDRYPANMAQRRELLAWIAGDAIRQGEELTEQQVNERLLSYTDDVVLLRRYLIDFGLLTRTPSGSSYSRQEEE